MHPDTSAIIQAIPGANLILVSPVSAVMALGTEAAELILTFPSSGLALALLCDPVMTDSLVAAMTPEAARTIATVRVKFGLEGGALVQNDANELAGTLATLFPGPAFMPLASRNGADGSWKVGRPVSHRERWRFTFRNQSLVTNNLRCQASVLFRPDYNPS